MKNLVLTLAVGPYEQLGRITHPTIRAYAGRIGADFQVINKTEIARTTPHWEKFRIYDLLAEYDRILYMDTDIIVREDCPDLFSVVPEDRLGAFNEARFTDRSRELMVDICKSYGEKLNGWNGRYYNTGVMVISKAQRELFVKPEKEVFSFWEQSYLNMMISKLAVPVHDLDYRFNRMTCMDRFTGEHRLASFVVHYAGCPDLRTLFSLIPKDLSAWRRGDIDTRRHLYISVSGGLGDQICAEPAVRFFSEKLYPEDEILVGTHYPELFRHISGVTARLHGEVCLKDDTAYFRRESLPGPDQVQWAIVSHLLCHSVDYSSIAIMKRTIPDPEKTVRFAITDADRESVREVLSGFNLSAAVVVHPGKHWNSKTFPVQWWQAVIDGISAGGVPVVIIGKEECGDPPDYIAGARGTVAVACPRNGIDLRERLTLGGLAVVLESAPVLISNDSAPVHLAGAFDNWIILIPSCKHPAHILPYRNGHQGYKTKALFKKLIIEEIDGRPTQVAETSAEVDVPDWCQYLPAPETVADEALHSLGRIR